MNFNGIMQQQKKKKPYIFFPFLVMLIIQSINSFNSIQKPFQYNKITLPHFLFFVNTYHFIPLHRSSLPTLKQNQCYIHCRLLTRSSIFTARVRSSTGGYVFTGVCLFNFWGWGVPHPADGGYPSKVWMEGYPIQLMGGTPSQVWTGIPHPRSGWGGYPIPGPDGGVTPGYPLPVRTRWGTPPSQDWVGYPPTTTMTGWGTPHHHDWMVPPPP